MKEILQTHGSPRHILQSRQVVEKSSIELANRESKYQRDTMRWALSISLVSGVIAALLRLDRFVDGMDRLDWGKQTTQSKARVFHSRFSQIGLHLAGIKQ